MNAGQTSERVYDALRRRILDHGFRPGDRLDPAMLADALTSSVTPVRDALHRLVGEGLVETGISEGFHLPAIDQPALQDLYAWSGELLGLSIQHWPRPIRFSATLGQVGDDPAAHAQFAATLFETLAGHSLNAEHLRAVAAVNARLHAARMIEAKMLEDIAPELATLADLARQGLRDALRAGLSRYHRRRRRAAADIVRLLYRAH